MKKRIVILATGGTIASTAATLLGDEYGYANIGIDDLLKGLPQIHELADIRNEQIAQVDSSDMTCEIWLKLGHRINELLARNDVDGVVVTHGTDTAEETGYFLNLVVKSRKPVILTGAMRPSESLSADGLRNLFNAVVIAVSEPAQSASVLLTFNDAITSARDVTKNNVSSSDSFRSPELGLLGYVYGHQAYFYKKTTTRHTYDSEFDIASINKLPKVDIIYGYADADPKIVDCLLKTDVKGIISAGLGNGLQPAPVLEALHRAKQQGVIVVRSSRVGNGVITAIPRIDEPYGFLTANSLNPQKARILLSLALTKTTQQTEIQRMFNQY